MIGVIPNFVGRDEVYSNSIKRALLLSDKIIIPDLSETEAQLTERDDWSYLCSDIAFLVKSDLCSGADPITYSKARSDLQARHLLDEERQLYFHPPAVGRTAVTLQSMGLPWDEARPEVLEAYKPVFARLRTEAEHYVARSSAL
jgi:hypothetical protein